MGKYDVTQEQYQVVIGTNPSNFIGKDNPVEQISWHDADGFCAKLSKSTQQAIRLPSEAEWEFACRAGTTTVYYSGNSKADLDRICWYKGNSNNAAHPVGQKDPNSFGLYDMLGNVFQLTQDGAENYSSSAQINPFDLGGAPAMRGGAFCIDFNHCKSASRTWYPRNDRVPEREYQGFRIVMTLAESKH